MLKRLGDTFTKINQLADVEDDEDEEVFAPRPDAEISSEFDYDDEDTIRRRRRPVLPHNTADLLERRGQAMPSDSGGGGAYRVPPRTSPGLSPAIPSSSPAAAGRGYGDDYDGIEDEIEEDEDDEDEDDDESELDSEQYAVLTNRRHRLDYIVNEPLDVYVCGMKGSGKSMMIQHLATKLGASIVRRPYLAVQGDDGAGAGAGAAAVDLAALRDAKSADYWFYVILNNVFQKVRNYADFRQSNTRFSLIESCPQEEFGIYVPFAAERGYLNDVQLSTLKWSVAPFVDLAVNKQNCFLPFRVYIFLETTARSCVARVDRFRQQHEQRLALKKQATAAAAAAAGGPAPIVDRDDQTSYDDRMLDQGDLDLLTKHYFRFFVGERTVCKGRSKFIVHIKMDEDMDEAGADYQQIIVEIVNQIHKAIMKRRSSQIIDEQLEDLAQKAGVAYQRRNVQGEHAIDLAGVNLNAGPIRAYADDGQSDDDDDDDDSAEDITDKEWKKRTGIPVPSGLKRD